MKRIQSFLFIIMILFTSVTVLADHESTGKSTSSSVSVSGTVIDKLTNESLPGVTILVSDSETKIYSDPDGNFTLSGLTPGSYTLKVSCLSYKSQDITVEVSEEKTDELKVQLESVEP